MLLGLCRDFRFQPFHNTFFSLDSNFSKEVFFGLPERFFMLFSFIGPGEDEDIRAGHFRAHVTSLHELEHLWPDDLAKKTINAKKWHQLPIGEDGIIHLKPPFDFVYSPTIEESRIL